MCALPYLLKKKYYNMLKIKLFKIIYAPHKKILRRTSFAPIIAPVSRFALPRKEDTKHDDLQRAIRTLRRPCRSRLSSRFALSAAWPPRRSNASPARTTRFSAITSTSPSSRPSWPATRRDVNDFVAQQIARNRVFTEKMAQRAQEYASIASATQKEATAIAQAEADKVKAAVAPGE